MTSYFVRVNFCHSTQNVTISLFKHGNAKKRKTKSIFFLSFKSTLPRNQQSLFIQLIYSCFLLYHVPFCWSLPTQKASGRMRGKTSGPARVQQVWLSRLLVGKDNGVRSVGSGYSAPGGVIRCRKFRIIFKPWAYLVFTVNPLGVYFA